jgi:hypothetical protein
VLETRRIVYRNQVHDDDDPKPQQRTKASRAYDTLPKKAAAITPLRHSVFGNPALVASRPRWKTSTNAKPHATAKTTSATMVTTFERPHAFAVRHLKQVAAHEKRADAMSVATANITNATQNCVPTRYVEVLPVSRRHFVFRPGEVTVESTDTFNIFHGTIAIMAIEHTACTMCNAADRTTENPRFPIAAETWFDVVVRQREGWARWMETRDERLEECDRPSGWQINFKSVILCAGRRGMRGVVCTMLEVTRPMSASATQRPSSPCALLGCWL